MNTFNTNLNFRFLKAFIFLSFILITLNVKANKYYISSSSGSDAYTSTQAQNSLTPWQSITKLNSFMTSIVAGDSILFKCGDTFFGSIVLKSSGSSTLPIVISSYGSGAKPLITGLTTLSSWTSLGSGIYEANCAAKNTLNMVTLDNIPQAVGRYPNAGTTNGGYLTYTGFTGNTALTSSGLSGTDWTGAEVVAKKEGYVLERDKIISQSGSTVTYTSIPTINPRSNASSTPMTPKNAGFGLFIQRDPRTLDQLGEWYFDTIAKKIKMHFGGGTPSAYTIKASILDTLLNINTRNYIHVKNLAFEGANLAAIYFQDAGNIIIQNNNIKFSGAKAIFGWHSPNVWVDSNAIEHSMCSAIDIIGRYVDNVIVSANTVKYTGILPGMSSFYDDADCKAIYISVDSIAVISKNKVDTTGYVPIQFQGAGIRVDSNYVNYYCFVKDDGGGIYTYSTDKTNRSVKNNIVINGIGAPDGNANPIHAEGIYMDGNAKGVDIFNNTVAYISNRGLYFNDPRDVNAQFNTAYSTANWSANKHYSDNLYNFKLKNNIFFNTFTISQNGKTYANTGLNNTTIPVAGTIQSALQQLGTIDSNYYQFVSSTPFAWYYASTYGGSYTFPANESFATWQSYTGHDAHSVNFSNAGIATQRFEYNATNQPVNVNLGSTIYLSLDGTLYNNSVTVQPFTSKILISNGTCTLPVDWSSSDIGSTSIAGSSCENSGTYTIQASGTDLFSSADGFRYTYKHIAGNNTIIAKINSFTGTGTYPKAGIMIRETLASGSKNAFLSLRPNGTCNLTYRDATSGSTSTASNTLSLSFPYWIKLTRVGTTIKGYTSSNGTTWTLKSTVTVSLTDSIYMGLAVCNNSNSALATATFNNVSIQTGEVLRPNLTQPVVVVNDNLFPNPTQGIFSLQINSPKAENVIISVTDVEGKVIRSYSRGVAQGTSRITLSIKDLNLSTGVYIIKVAGTRKSIYRLMVQ